MKCVEYVLARWGSYGSSDPIRKGGSDEAQLTLSCRGATLVRHMALPVHISSNNGLIDMIASEKVFTDVLAMHFNT